MIDVVIPVYRGAEQTRRCIDSVLANAQREPLEVIVVDDASPEPPIVAHLDALAAERRVTLLRNASNAGFVRSVNRAMALHAERDVVLLNSDTEVANDWLDRLHACAHRDARTGTVTPFSNHATICSYPFEGWTGGTPGALGLAGLDRVFARANARSSAELPTAVGFCMYIRRDCLADVGLFDSERFGRGYGEENDFCMRAAKAGWRNVLAADVFVFHEGAVSFSAERGALTASATQTIDELHPEYLPRVRAFIVRDPLAPLRAAVDRARVDCGADEARHVVAERAQERELLAARIVEADRVAREGIAAIEALRAGLAQAQRLAAERAATLAQRDAEQAQLSAAFAHAESLALARQAELDRIRRSWPWRAARLLLGRR